MSPIPKVKRFQEIPMGVMAEKGSRKRVTTEIKGCCPGCGCDLIARIEVLEWEDNDTHPLFGFALRTLTEDEQL